MGVAATFEQFGRNIEARGRIAEKNIVKIVQKTVAVTIAELYRRTPVDTGLARANWITSKGSPSTKITTTGHYPIATAASVAASIRPGDDITVWMANNVPYIEKLENGHSRQAPQGFLVASAAAGNRVLRGAAGLKVMGR